MLIVALVLAVIGLAALVTAVVTSNELIAWVCIAASVIGVVLLIVDALRERSRGDAERCRVANRGRRTPNSTPTIPTNQRAMRRPKLPLPQSKPATTRSQVAEEDRNTR